MREQLRTIATQGPPGRWSVTIAGREVCESLPLERAQALVAEEITRANMVLGALTFGEDLDVTEAVWPDA